MRNPPTVSQLVTVGFELGLMTFLSWNDPMIPQKSPVLRSHLASLVFPVKSPLAFSSLPVHAAGAPVSLHA